MKTLEEFLVPTQSKLYKAIRGMFKGYDTFFRKKAYILVKGEAPVMLVAHMDTVHEKPVKHICKTEDGNILMSPQGIGGDDRCGVYALVNAHEMSKVKPWLLFTCDEEIGGVGAAAFEKDYRADQLPKELADLKFIVEIDRRGKNDAVYYDCDNKEFEDYVTTKGFKTASGSFSDISYIAPALGVAAVNLSSGYYNAHTEHEYINRAEIDAVILKVVEMITDSMQDDIPQYKYVERKVVIPRGWSNYGIGFRGGELSFTNRKYELPNAKRLKSDEKVPEDVPWYLQEEYKLLLGVYTVDELEALRDMYGNEVIDELYDLEVDGIDSRDAFGLDVCADDVEDYGDDEYDEAPVKTKII